MGSCVLKAFVSWLLVNIKQLLDEVFVISRIIKVEVRGYQLKLKAEADSPYGDLDYSGCHKS